MEIGQYQLQIFFSLVVVLGAACVALICDFLKGNNEQLREMLVELKVRNREERRRFQTMVPQTVTGPASAEAPEAERKIETRAARSMATPKEPKRALAPEALAAMERGAQLAGTPRTRTADAPMPARAERKTATPVPEKKTSPVSVVVTPSKPVSAMKTTAKTTVTSKKDWTSLLASQTKPAVPVPTGFHDGYILRRLLQTRQPVSGLVVSIGVNTAREIDGSVPEAVKQVIQSLIGAGDFACQSSDEEFLLIYPNDHGASAQRKLSQIAQQLWDFQLSSMGTFSILFSWGGVEVASESIDEAIASANERMQETRRGRKLLTMQSRAAEAPLKQAV